MKFLLKVSLIGYLLIALSCTKEVTPELKLSIASVEIPNVDGVVKIQVTSNTDWSVSLPSNWCTATPTSGSGNGEITITATDNNSTETRTASLLVTCKDIKKAVSISQAVATLNLSQNALAFLKTGESKQINITSNTSWQLVIPQGYPWLTITPTSGKGNGVVNVTAAANTGMSRSTVISISYAGTQKTFTVAQERGVNNIPTKPILTFPSDNQTTVNRLPLFQWTQSTDTDGDVVTYKLEYSTDQTNWVALSNTTTNSISPASSLQPSTTYYWKVTANDGFGGVVVSNVGTFTTGTNVAYADGEYKVYQTNTLGIAPCEIIVVGDGYVANDFADGGLFDQDANMGIEGFFNVEPYKSYRNYFKVYKLAGYSAESGVTQADKSITKNTCFSSSFNGGSSLSANTDKVFLYAKKIPGMTDAKLRTTLVILILNQNRYAGTCWMWSDGKAVAICPVSRNSNVGAHYVDLVHHEAGGHGWAGLADEYINNTGKTITAEDKKDLLDWSALGYYSNVDVTSDLTLVKWKHFVGKTGYSRVGAFEGAYYYSLGAWRSEQTSCMINNIPYFSAPSREAAVKKIMRVAGGTYNLDNFVASDTQKAPTAAVLSMTKSYNPLTFVPLAAPVRINVR